MKRTCLSLVAVVFLCSPLLAQQKRATKRAEEPSVVVTSDTAKPAAPPAGTLPGARVVQYRRTDIVKLNAKVRYTSLIVLPQDERILDFVCGDKEFWVVNGTQNLAYVKPAKTGSQTNLNLITASGNIYSFALSEVSDLPEAAPDLKVFVELEDESMRAAASDPPRFVSTQVVDDYRQQVELAKGETRDVKEAAQDAIDKGIRQFVSNVRFPYRFDAGKKPFGVRAIYHDDKYTYIQARPEETPTLYEIKDGQPNLVNFEYKDGVYVVEKILDQGYLAIGKAKLAFKREE